MRRVAACWLLLSVFLVSPLAAEPLRIGTFQVDGTPPIGSPLCDGLVPPAATSRARCRAWRRKWKKF